MAPVPITAEALALSGIRHAFFTREGGVSDGIYASLNTGLGSEDRREAVLENRARACRHLGAPDEALATPHQVHSADCFAVTEAWAPGKGPRGDALATDRPGIVIGIGTADCGPILFADPQARVVGAAHAGWKGALTGVLESTLAAMEALGARREAITAVLGPTISAKNYEVGAEFVERFDKEAPGSARFFAPSKREGHSMFDLPAFIVARLQAAGVGLAVNLDLCTYAEEELFFSYRRATHRGEPDYGRLLSAISLA
ncbi:peptidoglycan editing factor PgeF [Afifella sp. IM 167]|uniref:peptidoglycan editing factor PgeF n=1 Tax=Afifella sp. IM 167 TaxID=2033586 RepID=UPI001CCA627D|nr:peptidoglycan editing factor PgeF [Afifella sp. IM 167]MBZ8134884.1 polyphenol oxidase [Afifella sp. IM 167]